MSGHHPRNVRESWAEDAKPDKNDCRTGKRISTSRRQNRRGLRHIAFKEHRHLMFKMTPGGVAIPSSLRDNPEVSVRSHSAIDDAGTCDRDLIETVLS
jgi:hypothetical protein